MIKQGKIIFTGTPEGLKKTACQDSLEDAYIELLSGGSVA
jgi:ABC-type Na+ transport system ATPase subunit NatA